MTKGLLSWKGHQVRTGESYNPGGHLEAALAAGVPLSPQLFTVLWGGAS